MEFAIEYINNFIYVWCFICVGKLFFDYNQRNIKYEKWIRMFLILIITIMWFFLDAIGQLLIHVISLLIILHIYFHENARKVVGLYITVTAMLSMIYFMINMVSNEILTMMKISDEGNVSSLMSHIILLIYVGGMGKFFEHQYRGKVKKISNKYLFLLGGILLLDALVVAALAEFVISNTQASNKFILISVYSIVVLGIMLQISLLINALITRNIYKENEIVAKQFLENQQDHYSYLEKREYETKRFRHDIKNHLLVLEHCIEQQEYEDALRYIEALNDKVNAFSNHISVNNNYADAILNKFYFEAKEQEIELEVKGHFPLECSIAAFDICTILSNLLSNAILAEKQCGGKSVRVEIRYTPEEVILLVENDYGHKLQEENGVLKTSKSDSENHGFGLENVKSCVKKAGGYISIATKDQRFKVMLSLKNKYEEKV